jgi:hypothetical protein
MWKVASPQAKHCKNSKDSSVCPDCPFCPRFQNFSPRIQNSNILLKMRTNGTNGTNGTIPERNQLLFFCSNLIPERNKSIDYCLSRLSLLSPISKNFSPRIRNSNILLKMRTIGTNGTIRTIPERNRNIFVFFINNCLSRLSLLSPISKLFSKNLKF